MPPRRQKKHKKQSSSSNLPTEQASVFQFTSKWGKDKDNYYGNADSGTESDDEHLIEEAIEEEGKRLSHLKAEDFEAFDADSIKKIDHKIEKPEIDISILEHQIDEEETEELKKTVSDTVNQLIEATQMLQADDLPPYERQLLNSVMTNASFYLYLVSTGYKSPSHPSIEHNAEIFRLLTGKGEEEEDKEEHAGEEEEVMEEEEEVKEEKHIPDHLRKIGEGEFRQVSNEILHNRAVVANTPKFRHNPRTARGKKYSHALHQYNMTHKKKHMPLDGVYKGERAGISKEARSVSLAPAH